MKKALTTAVLAAAIAAPVSSQCPGQGNLTFELTSVNNDGTGPGALVDLRISGAPNTIICLTCDSDFEAYELPGLGTLCVDLGSPSFLEFVFTLPDTGVLEVQFNVPENELGDFLCCQALGLDFQQIDTLQISNAICLGQENCESGGVGAIGVTTKLADVTLPTTVTVEMTGTSGGGGNGSASVEYDPNNPPSFPIFGTSGVTIENIAQDGDCLHVISRIEANPGMQHQAHDNRLSNNMTFTTSGGGDSNSQTIHTSCSQPLGVGMTFGDYTVTELKFPM